MRLRIIAVGSRMPGWVDAAVAEYSQRIRLPWRLEWIEIETGDRSSGGLARAIEREGERVLAALKGAGKPVLLDERGREYTTREFAGWLERCGSESAELALLLGGPDGHAPAVRARAVESLSLSRLTLPHALARVVLAEQIYRAQSVLNKHPYHRD